MLFVAALILGGCSPQSAPTTNAAASNSDPVGEAYQLLLQNSADPVTPAALGKAAVGGIRTELAVQGVIPPDVPDPTFTSDPSQDLLVIHSTAQAVSSQYR